MKQHMADARAGKLKRKPLIVVTHEEMMNYIRFHDFGDEMVRDQKDDLSDLSSFHQTESSLIIERANGHRREFNSLRELINVLDREELEKLYEFMKGYYIHIPPNDLGKKFQDDMVLMMKTGKDAENDIWSTKRAGAFRDGEYS